MRLHYSYSIPSVNPKLSNQRVGPFKVLEKVENLAYRLKLPSIIRIHPVISIIQLEPAFKRDPYTRIPKQPILLVEEENNVVDPDFATKYPLYKIEKLTKRRGSGKNIKYLVY